MQQSVTFPSGTVNYIFQSSVEEFLKQQDMKRVVFVTNEHIARLYPQLFKNQNALIIPPGEQTKDLRTIESLTKQLLQKEATRNTLLVGVGGGVITDITGFLGSVYMRGISFGFVPTSLLGMADAAIGGKNGVNMGMNKNILGVTKQPEFIVFDNNFLQTLPDDEWSNGFAEIIKYACIFDPGLFEELGKNNITSYRNMDSGAITNVIEKCVAWKNKTVLEDEKDNGVRKLLNFGHTAAHAIENLYDLPHGKAVGIGMVIACMVSENVAGLDKSVTEKLRNILSLYHLPIKIKIDAARAMEILKMDKKRNNDTIDYIVLEKIGKAAIHALPVNVIEKTISSL